MVKNTDTYLPVEANRLDEEAWTVFDACQAPD